MRAIPVQLPDAVYDVVDEYARAHNCSAEQVVVEALEEWRTKQADAQHSLLSLPPLDLGPMRPVADEDLLGEMLG